MKPSSLIKSYEEVKDTVDLVDLNSTQLAGYYLLDYKNDPLGMLNEDILNLRVPFVVGSCTKTILTAVRGK